MSPECNACGQSGGDYGPYVWAQTRAGKWVLVEPLLHRRACKGRPKAAPKPAKAPAQPEYVVQAHTDLMGAAFRMNSEEAWDRIAEAGVAEDYDSLMLACIKAGGTE